MEGKFHMFGARLQEFQNPEVCDKSQKPTSRKLKPRLADWCQHHWKFCVANHQEKNLYDCDGETLYLASS
jgi:hypothetical protein